jgi:pyruvate kinase
MEMPEMKQTKKADSLRWRRTKIIATIGPGTDSTQRINAMISAGVNVFRLNMSHGDYQYHSKVHQRIRRCAEKRQAMIATMLDLCGPKIRTGKFEGGSIWLNKNDKVVISCTNGKGRDGLIISQYRNLYKDVKPGERILFDDGNMECRVINVDGSRVNCKVIYGGELKDHKGINLPDSDISTSSFTARDKRDVKLAMELKADYVALSFVRQAKDIQTLQRFMKRVGDEIPVIAKIEKPEAVNNIDEILEYAYGIMIARGDLGIELPAEKVPLIQKRLINLARGKHRPVIVATQMMESMIHSSRPTRAEVGDVANAAMLSADAVMLSAETAIGRYPVKAVQIMDRILREIEFDQWHHQSFGDSLKPAGTPSSRYAIAHAANTLALDLNLQGILVPTTSGHTAAVLSSSRPSSPLIGISTQDETCRRLALHWGIIPHCMDSEKTRNWKVLSNEMCRQYRLTATGNRVLLVSGFKDNERLNEPVMKIINVNRR